jgi:ribosome-binding factor A
VSVRSAKVGSLIKEELSSMFQRNYSMKEIGLLTITEVIMSPDLKIAKVYISVFGDAEQKKKSLSKLHSQKSSIRSTLGHALSLRYTPDIYFYLDESLDQAMKLEDIFNKIHEQDSGKEEQNSSSAV